MKKISLLIICILIVSSSCKKDIESQDRLYLYQWVGEYEGPSHYWSIQFLDTIYRFDYNGTVKVDVQRSNLDSSLNLIITYDDSIPGPVWDLKISPSGTYYSNWGSGSSAGWLSVSFNSDSMAYDYFQKSGVPNSAGTDFKIKKN